MKFEILVGMLKDGLKVVSRAINKKASLPVLGNVLIEAKDGYLALSGTNLEISLRTRVKAAVEEEGAVTLPAQLLGSLLSVWPEDAPAEAVLDEKTQTITLTTKHASAEVKGISAKEYAEIPNPSDWEHVMLDAFALRTTLDRCVFAASASEARPILTGVYVHRTDDGLTWAAADGFRLSVVKMGADLPEGNVLEQGVIIPKATLQELMRLIPGAGKPVTVCFRPESTQVAFVILDRNGGPETVLVSQLISGNFPHYQEIVPKTTSLSAVAGPELQDAVDGALVFAAHSANITKWYISERRIVVHGAATEFGEQVGETSAETQGKAEVPDGTQWEGKHPLIDGELVGVFAVNGEMMREVLGVMDSDVRIRITTPSSPIIVEPADDDGFTHVLMPMHLGD